MRKKAVSNKSVEKIPTYCLNYLINGEIEGLTRQEVEEIDLWWNFAGVIGISPIRDDEGNMQPYFSSLSYFGMPSEVVDCVVIYKNKN